MIYKALHIITNKLEQYLSSRYQQEEKIVLLSSPVADYGTNTSYSNKLLISLVNIERDSSMGINFRSVSSNKEQIHSGRPAIYLNLYVLISTNFTEKNYDESLKYLSTTLQMLQTNDLLTIYNTPELYPEISKLHLELVNTSFQELSNLWGILGGKYQPSILLKIRMLTIDPQETTALQRSTQSVEIQNEV